MKNFNYIVFAALFLLMLLPSADLLAQCTFPGGCCPDGLPPSFCPGCPPCVPVPLDGGLSALLIAGFAYGAKRVYGKAK
ncbi:MAG: hypothetical protein P8Q14_12230 [Vicingaceae bacterium]|nr:hypothetical protein [Vicingaceae bacterium]